MWGIEADASLWFSFSGLLLVLLVLRKLRTLVGIASRLFRRG